MRHKREELVNQLQVGIMESNAALRNEFDGLDIKMQGSEAGEIRTCPWTSVMHCLAAASLTLGWQWP